jgi:hypothetical protein
MTTGFLDCCAPRWHGLVRRYFADAVAEGATGAAAVLTAVQQVVAADLDLAASHGEVALYEGMMALLVHHRREALVYAETVLEEHVHAA